MPLPHNYSDRIKGVYYYISAISQNDKASGETSGEAVGFRYIGKNDDGEYILVNINSYGDAMWSVYCHNPCVVVRYENGETRGFNPNSVIGEAFNDVFAGQLEVGWRQ